MDKTWLAVTQLNTRLFGFRELGRTENALGRAASTVRYGQRAEWRIAFRDAAADTLHEARAGRLGLDSARLQGAVGSGSWVGLTT